VRTVVGTVMSNLGLECALRSLGVELVRADVGDRHVYSEMKRLNVELGGEPSGHIIIRSLQRSGDGLLSGLHFFAALAELGLSGRDLLRQRPRFPQGLKSIRVSRKPDLRSWDALQALERTFSRETGGKQARLLVRYSGTEPKIRVMVEADEPALVETWMTRFEHFIMDTIGENK
jgi:phosphoglucosamine mutase